MNESVAVADRAFASDAKIKQFLTVHLGQELFALPIHFIREIIEFVHLTQVPMVPGFLRGVINLRGAVVPVIDLAVRFERERTEIGKRTCIVILELHQAESEQLLGILVDEVREVVEIAEDQLEPRPSFGVSVRLDFVQSIIKQQDGFISVLELSQVLHFDELATLVGARTTEA